MTEPEILNRIAEVLKERRNASPESSYAASLYAQGSAKILDKIREEAGEAIEAGGGTDDARLVAEVADLWFHCMVLLAYRNIDIGEVFAELGRRFGISGHEEKRRRGH